MTQIIMALPAQIDGISKIEPNEILILTFASIYFGAFIIGIAESWVNKGEPKGTVGSIIFFTYWIGYLLGKLLSMKF